MITGNLYFRKTPNWESYRRLVLIPELASHMIREQGYANTSPLRAYVNYGRWCVKCECGGGEFAWDEGWMMCRSCFNAKHGHKYRPVVFPKDKERIEQILMVRPLDNRNWRPGESISDLQAENERHSAELLEVR